MTYYLHKGRIVARSYPGQDGSFRFEEGTQFKSKSPCRMGDGFYTTRMYRCENRKELRFEIRELERRLHTSLEQVEVSDEEKTEFIARYGV